MGFDERYFYRGKECYFLVGWEYWWIWGILVIVNCKWILMIVNDMFFDFGFKIRELILVIRIFLEW